MHHINNFYLAAFSIGLAGGFGHCIGMCGPIVASIPQNSKRKGLTVLSHLFYNLGRITTYGLLGFIAAYSGASISRFGLVHLVLAQRIIMLLTGIFIILMGAAIVGILPFGSSLNSCPNFISIIKKPLMRLKESKSVISFFPIGIVLGFLPCGLLYSALLLSLRLGAENPNRISGAIGGALFMILFGIGTAMALMLLGTSVSLIKLKLRSNLYKLSGVFIMLLGIIFTFKAIKMI